MPFTHNKSSASQKHRRELPPGSRKELWLFGVRGLEDAYTSMWIRLVSYLPPPIHPKASLQLLYRLPQIPFQPHFQLTKIIRLFSPSHEAETLKEPQTPLVLLSNLSPQVSETSPRALLSCILCQNIRFMLCYISQEGQETRPSVAMPL
jgi:hypothetical protein